MGVARIPFLDFDVLHSELQRVLPSLPESLQRRNRVGATRLYVAFLAPFLTRSSTETTPSHAPSQSLPRESR